MCERERQRERETERERDRERERETERERDRERERMIERTGAPEKDNKKIHKWSNKLHISWLESVETVNVVCQKHISVLPVLSIYILWTLK